MRKVFLFLAFVALASFAAPKDTCKIGVKRINNGLCIDASSNNVYVRNGNSIDQKNYIFLADTLLEIVCDDRQHTVQLKGGHQKGKVSCWSQKAGKESIQDTNALHQLAPSVRRNWLTFKSMNASTQVELAIIDDIGKEVKLDIRKLVGWNRSQIKGNYFVNDNEGHVLDKELKMQDGFNKFIPLELKENEKLQKFVLKKNKQLIKVQDVKIDNNSVPFDVYSDVLTKTLQDDDMMFDTEINIELSNEKLTEGKHIIVYECIALTQQGVENIQIEVPIEVEAASHLLAYGLYILIILVVLSILFFVGYKYYNKKTKRNIIKESKEPLSETISKGGDDDTKSVESDLKNEPLAGDNLGEVKMDLQEPQQSSASEEDRKELKSKIIRKIIEKWNSEHPENLVDKNQMNIDSLFRVICKGYISPNGKTFLERSIHECRINTQNDLISANVLSSLFVAFQNKGCQEAIEEYARKGESDSSNEKERYVSQVERLSQEKEELQKKIRMLETDKNDLQLKYNKIQKDFEALGDDNYKQIQTVEEQEKIIADLKQQIDAQSQEHVDELERRIDQLGKNLIAGQETIRSKDDEIVAEQDKVKKLTIQKEKWENDCRKAKELLSEIGNKHQEELSAMMEAHKEASLKQKDKFDKQLSDIKEELIKQQDIHNANVEKLKHGYEEQLTKQREDSEASVQKLKDKQDIVISELNVKHQSEVDKLNATIKELGVSVNVGRDDIINHAERLFKLIESDLSIIDKSVNSIVNQSPIFVNNITNILDGLQATYDEFADVKNTDWSAPDKLQAQVIEDMQNLFINALNRTGWINNVARLFSYSRLPKLHDGIDLPGQFEAHGISVAILERVYSNIVNLLGIAEIGILVPAVLANNFDKENYEYKNGDTWIDRYFPEVSTRNYKGKVFDIVQIGYTIDGVIEKKPVVQYN